MNFELEKIKEVNLMLNSLCIFKDFLKDDVMSPYEELINYLNKNEFDINVFLKIYNTFTYNLMEKSKEISIRAYIIDKIIEKYNILKQLLDKNTFSSEKVLKQIKYELNLLQELSKIKSQDIKKCISQKGVLSEFETHIIENLFEWNEGESIQKVNMESNNVKFNCENKYNDNIYKLKDNLFKNEKWGNFLEDILSICNQ